MPIEELVPVNVREAPPKSRYAWAVGRRFNLPRSLLAASGLRDCMDPQGNLVIPQDFPTISHDYGRALRLSCAFTEKKPAATRLPFSYQLIPAKVRTIVARLLGMIGRRRLLRNNRFPNWPLDLSADFLADLAADDHCKPVAGPTPVLLTHDLDTAEGLHNLVTMFLDREEQAGARSTNFIVPYGWPIPTELLDQVITRGHHLGIHGYDHSNQTAFLDPAKRRERLTKGKDLIHKYQISGYRSPSMLRTPGLLHDLSQFFQWDSSIPTSGGLFPIPFRGCASARPFTVEGICEIPLSLPPDGSLGFMSYKPQEIFKLWTECAESIASSGGIVMLLTHCENRFSGNPESLAAYRAFLNYIGNSPRFRWALPNEIFTGNDGNN